MSCKDSYQVFHLITKIIYYRSMQRHVGVRSQRHTHSLRSSLLCVLPVLKRLATPAILSVCGQIVKTILKC